MNNTHAITIPTTAFKLKGSLFTLTVAELFTDDTDAIAKQLANLIKKTPNFFHDAPIVIDVNNLAKLDHTPNLTSIWETLRQAGLIPVALRASSDHLIAAIQAQKLPLLGAKPSKSPAQNEENGAKTPRYQTQLITRPVRSGQRIVAENANLIILASVSTGAELLADGNIHVYGTLRGRALAGVQGDVNAQIFCNQLQAELVSIAGFYLLADEIQKQVMPGKHTRVFLADKQVSLCGFE